MGYITGVEEWKSPAGILRLERFPFKGDKSHRALDAADEWIASKLPDLSAGSPEQRILLTGEAFGVLAALWGRNDITVLSNSLLSLRAAEHNRSLNPLLCSGSFRAAGITEPLQNSSEAGAGTVGTGQKPFGTAVIRIPKSLELLEIYIRETLWRAGPETDIWLGGMDRRWGRGVKKITDAWLSAGEVFPFERHARWIRFRPGENHRFEEVGGTRAEKSSAWSAGRYPVKIIPAQAVFSSKSIDQGTAAFLEGFPEDDVMSAGRIADLGCGSGILGLCAAALNPGAHITFTDESFLAVKAAAENARLNGFADRTSVMTANGLSGVDNETLDLVLCNPPFHYKNIQSREPSEFMFKEAARCLKKQGVLQIVGNSHLGYHKHLQRFFKNVSIVYKNSKFSVIRASGQQQPS